MLLSCGAKNFFCFKEGIELSLELGVQCPIEISRGRSVANLLCIKGANGSGKTNALKILAFLKNFCCNSFNEKPEESIAISSFFNNTDPVELFCEFIFDNIEYRYELTVTTQSIISEKISRKINRLTRLFERDENTISYSVKEFNDLYKIKQRSNASIISAAHQYGISSISPIYNFFNSIISNVSSYGHLGFPINYRQTSDYYFNHPEIFKSAVEIIMMCDLGISDVVIHESKNEDEIKYHYPIFQHDAKVEKNWLTYHDQSLGTQTLFRTLLYYIYALKTGGLLLMDEFDMDFHPHMLEMILKYFDNEETNPKNAQMLFSTHNTDIIDYMGKYRTVLVNKEKSESFGYRLDEIPGDIIRNDRLLSPVYNSGKIGGVPRI